MVFRWSMCLGCLRVEVFRCSGFRVQVVMCLGVLRVFKCSRAMTFRKDQKGDQGRGPKIAKIEYG